MSGKMFQVVVGSEMVLWVRASGQNLKKRKDFIIFLNSAQNPSLIFKG